MHRKGFILVTSLLILLLVSFLAFNQFAYLQAIGRQLNGYYKFVQAQNSQKSELAYQQWLSKK